MKNKTGFTLIEILITMAILGILATLILGSYIASMRKGRDARRKGNLDSISKALEFYYTDHEIYPPASANGEISACSGSPATCAWGTPWDDGTSLYMAVLPDDPRGNRYVYVVSPTQDAYQLYALLENTEDAGPNVCQLGYDGTNCGDGKQCTYGVASTNTILAGCTSS